MSTLVRGTAAFLTCFAVTSASAFVIETASQWNGTDAITYVGNPTFATATYGQTFKVTEAAVIQSWTFWLSNRSGNPQPDVRLDGYLAEWTDDRAVGPPLYASSEQKISPSPRGEFHALTFAIPNVLLDPNRTYVMFLNTSPYATLQQPFELAALGSTGNVYDDGAFWYQDSHNLLTNVFSYPWTCADEGSGCRYGDAAFEAVFAPVPEPTPITLLVIGVALILLVRRNGPNPSFEPTATSKPASAS